MRRALVVVLAALALAAPAAPAAAKRTTADAIKAARYLAAWRIEEARAVIDGLVAEAPDRPEARWLRGELRFVDGDYAGALAAIAGLPDDAIDGNVGALRRLATTTEATTRGFVRVASPAGHFVITYAPGKDEAIAALAGDVLDQAYAVLKADLGYAPPTPIRVELLGSPRDLAKLSTLTVKDIETTGTIALCKYNKLMVVSPRATVFGYPWMDTLVHEYVHLLVSKMSHDEVPVWLQEGLARFLQSRWRGAPTTDLSPTDEHLLATALKKDDLISFDAMHPSMAKLPTAEAAALAFAEVNTMVGYLHGAVGTAGLRQVIELVKQGKSARRAVAEVHGGSWDDVERGWKKALREAKLEARGSLAGRAHAPRVRFKKGSGDDEGVGLDEVASAKARKHTRLGGILRARGRSDAAAIQYEKALAAAPGDPFVGAKLSRTYLELGRYDQAIALAAPLAEADPSDAAPATTLGIARLAKGDAPGAAAAFEAALRVSPFDPAVRCGLAEAYGKTGQAALADREANACALVRR